MKNIFTEHPKSVNETYFQHLIFAFGIGLSLLLWGSIALVHGLLPFAFKTYVSDRIKELHSKIIHRDH